MIRTTINYLIYLPHAFLAIWMLCAFPSPTSAEEPRPWAVIKANGLLWAGGAPNVQMELPIGRNHRWSVEAEYFQPWWIWNHNAKAEQLFDVGLELRYWLGNRQEKGLLDGHHVGIAFAAGYYDLEWKRSNGYQGSSTTAT